MSGLSDLLDAEFLALAKASREKVRATNAAQAAFLKVDPALLSRLRNGRAELKRARALQFAEKLRPGDDQAQSQLVDRLVESNRSDRLAPEPPGGPDAEKSHLAPVQDLFERLGRTGAIACVEYRSIPLMNRTQREYGPWAAKAIRDGCSLALFQPFGTDFERGPGCHLISVRNYLQELRDEVRTVFKDLRRLATQDETDESRKRAIASRIALYEFAPPDNPPFMGSGIQTRVLYAEIPRVSGKQTGQITSLLDASVSTEVWDMTERDGRDVYVKRSDSGYARVIGDQFFPVLHYFRRELRLPQSNPELQKATEDLATDERFQTELEVCPWRIYAPQDNSRKSR